MIHGRPGLPDLGASDVRRRSGPVEDRLVQDAVLDGGELRVKDSLRRDVGFPQERAPRVGDP